MLLGRQHLIASVIGTIFASLARICEQQPMTVKQHQVKWLDMTTRLYVWKIYKKAKIMTLEHFSSYACLLSAELLLVHVGRWPNISVTGWFIFSLTKRSEVQYWQLVFLQTRQQDWHIREGQSQFYMIHQRGGTTLVRKETFWFNKPGVCETYQVSSSQSSCPPSLRPASSFKMSSPLKQVK